MKTAPMGSRGLHRRIEPYQGRIRGRICAIRVPSEVKFTMAPDPAAILPPVAALPAIAVSYKP